MCFSIAYTILSSPAAVCQHSPITPNISGSYWAVIWELLVCAQVQVFLLCNNFHSKKICTILLVRAYRLEVLRYYLSNVTRVWCNIAAACDARRVMLAVFTTYFSDAVPYLWHWCININLGYISLPWFIFYSSLWVDCYCYRSIWNFISHQTRSLESSQCSLSMFTRVHSSVHQGTRRILTLPLLILIDLFAGVKSAESFNILLTWEILGVCYNWRPSFEQRPVGFLKK